MEILGVGPMEFFFIVALALILLGPKDMAKAGTTIGKWLNNFVKSDIWKVMREASKTVSALPTTLMREANFEELQKELKSLNPAIPLYDEMDAIKNAPPEFHHPHRADPSADAPEENSIQPPRSQSIAPGKSVPAEGNKPIVTTSQSSESSATSATTTEQGNKENA